MAATPRREQQSDHTEHAGGHGSFWHFIRNLPWIFDRFWMSDVNRYVVEQARLQPGERALDIGAGLGPATVAAVTGQPECVVIAVDPSRDMRFVMRLRRLAQSGRGRIRVRDGVAERLPVASHSIDVAWAVNAVHHFSDQEAAMSGIAQALKPGGRLLLVEEDFDNPEHEFYSWTDDHEPYDEQIMNGLPIAEVSGALDSAGFEEIAVARPVVNGVPVIELRAVRGPLKTH